MTGDKEWIKVLSNIQFKLLSVPDTFQPEDILKTFILFFKFIRYYADQSGVSLKQLYIYS